MQEVLGLLCQFIQLGCTYLIITTASSKYQPLEEPWFAVEGGFVPVMQAFATCIATVGSGVLLAGVLTGHVDGAGMLLLLLLLLDCQCCIFQDVLEHRFVRKTQKKGAGYNEAHHMWL
jgi:hypothetical protein